MSALDVIGFVALTLVVGGAVCAVGCLALLSFLAALYGAEPGTERGARLFVAGSRVAWSVVILVAVGFLTLSALGYRP